ncbi:MAG TPA: GNAT family N-acetyltransferase [Flavisolibacter sp.]|nr:GNAT family N-acetyltransferase [Flavisolibacter sp.]
MQTNFDIKRTTTADEDFQLLVSLLDNELWNELNEDQATYDPYNKVPDIKTAVVICADNQPAACGCFKIYDSETVEIKRMFVQKIYRGRGLSKQILNALEQWAIEKGYSYALLETSVHFKVARRLYETSGYTVVENYPPYTDLAESICMKKHLKTQVL